jgi:hypothetical protein
MNERNQLEKALMLFMEKTGQQELWAKCLQEVASQTGNAISVIFPYRHQGMWVFDDESVGLDKEPFVAGADDLIDLALAQLGIKDADKGFCMVFSETEFPDVAFRLDWLRAEAGGNVYYSEELGEEGWLCPALLCYFTEPPRQIFVKIEGRNET